VSELVSIGNGGLCNDCMKYGVGVVFLRSLAPLYVFLHTYKDGHGRLIAFQSIKFSNRPESQSFKRYEQLESLRLWHIYMCKERKLKWALQNLVYLSSPDRRP
jgi:hypothetical protein